MEHLTFFHDHSMIIIMITSIITINMSLNLMNITFSNLLMESHQTESFWTLAPALMLMFIAIPSLKTLFLMEETSTPIMSVKTMGFQWFWSYEYSFTEKKNFSSLFSNSKSLNLLMNSQSLIIPTFTPARLLISSKDVIHSWTMPSLGVKTDAIPGRINQNFFSVKRPGMSIGQCSEICGAGHSFMPIMIESPSVKMFLNMF